MVGEPANFQAWDTDLILATLPRSGTLWLKSLSFATINRTRYPTSSKEHPLLTTSPHDLVPFLEFKHLYGSNSFPDFTKFQSPRVLAVHVPYHSLAESIKNTPNCKIVYLCRNPKDNFISIWQFQNRLKAAKNVNDPEPLPIEEALDLFCHGVSLYGPFWDHLLGYWKESLEKPEKVLFLKYEDMMKDPKPHLKRLAEFSGYPFSLEEENEGVLDEILGLSSFDLLKNLDVNKDGITGFNVQNKIFFRKGEVGDWKNHLTPLMAERVDRLIEEKLHGSGLVFSN
ncbi:Sulfotransferase domain [Macleaya cordata]|uniref:Sulfotransferase n=1 Tax=Macleaya cordata TaxID=56857 RepID=A0A200Q5G8_MACCD|nr:Sulfotransferase domain [Macleaya cordata]